MNRITGYTAMTECLHGDELVWKSQEEGGELMPDIYPTLREVQEEIVEGQVEQLESFRLEERDYEEIQWEPDSYPVYIEIENGKIQCWTDEHKEHRVYCNELKYWQENC